MVWLAAGGSTAVFGFLVYKYLSLPTTSSVAENTGEELRVDEKIHRDDSPSFTFDVPEAEQPVLPASQSQNARPGDLSNGTIHNQTSEPEQKKKHSPNLARRPPQMATPSLRSQSPPRRKPPTFSSMPAPPRPGGTALRPPPSASASLRVPVKKVLSNTSMAPTSSIMPQNSKRSLKVMLQPGHSPLDWAMLTKSPNAKLRGKDAPDHLIRVTPSQLKYHNGRKGRDAWSVYQGKVYNITPYLPFHPGGEGELMRGAAKDAEQLFMEVHPWVNWDNMLSECMVGILVGAGEEKDDQSGGLDEMD